MTKRKRPAPQCRKCGSTDITSTSSQQTRVIHGKKRKVADAICNACGHSWWSVHPGVRAIAREMDRERETLTT